MELGINSKLLKFKYATNYIPSTCNNLNYLKLRTEKRRVKY